MQDEFSHLTDPVMLLAEDGELDAGRAEHLRTHLAACPHCRARKRRLEDAFADVIGLQQETIELPTSAGPRALLKAQLAARMARNESRTARWWERRWAPALAAAAVLVVLMSLWSTARQPAPLSRDIPVWEPKASLTPGATILAGVADVCSAREVQNRPVPVALQRRVFEEYGISGAAPHAYEVDYLITPALGGADDIHNLWPQSYSATVWNARVKDALEDRLHQLVCSGQLDLATAQRDISRDWIAAYKKYFGTERPLLTVSPERQSVLDTRSRPAVP